MSTSHGWPANLKSDPNVINVIPEKEHPPETAACIHTIPKRQQSFEIFTPTKKRKFQRFYISGGKM